MGRPLGGVDLAEVAQAVRASPHPVLVALDVDGTLSPLVPRADQARLLPGATDALTKLASAGAAVAVVSGRGLGDLRQQFHWPGGLRLIGSHGLEDTERPDVVPTAEERQRLQAVEALSERAARRVAGTWVEAKVAGVAFHYRQARPAAEGSRVAQQLAERLDRMDGVWLRRGHLVLEAAVRPASKAEAVEGLRREAGAAAVLYVGDDETDEDVFRAFGPPHVTVRVGPGETAARYRLADPEQVLDLLQAVVAELTPSPR